MSDLIALLLWLTGSPPQDTTTPPLTDQGPVMAPMGGGIPIKPASE
jgi:hypothetical protein